MKPTQRNRRDTALLLSLGLAAASVAPPAFAQSTWTGGGADTNWSTALNWDVAPAAGTPVTTPADVVNTSTTLSNVDTTGIVVGAAVTGTGIDAGTTVTAIDAGLNTVTLSLPATADGTAVDISFNYTDTLIFDGSAGLANTNDYVTDIGKTAGATCITFAAGAGAFVLDDDGAGGALINFGTQSGNTVFVAQNSPNDQEIALNLRFAGNQKFRDVIFGADAGTLTISGDINFANDQLSVPGSSATGTLVLSGNNTGDGKGGVINAGTNTMRASLNFSEPTNLVLGSSTALGNHNVDSANLRGLNIGNDGTGTVITTLDDMDLTGANKADYSIAYYKSFSYAGLGDLEFGGLISTATNGRSFNVSGAGAGEVIISGQGVYLTQRTGAQLMILQPLDGNTLTLNGPITDTFQSGGVEAQKAGYGGVMTDGILRLQGDGTVNINADNSTTFNGELFLNSANLTVKLGHADALGTYGGGTDVNIFDVTANTYNGDPIVDMDTTNVLVGDEISGPGIQAGSVVVTVDDPTYLTLDLPATADGSGVTLTVTSTVTTIAGRTDMNKGVLDLNGFTLNEEFVRLGGAVFYNSNTGTPAEIVTEILNQGNAIFDGPGDIIAPNIRRTNGVTRRNTKNGTGTLTLGGDQSNGRYGLTVNEGDVVLAKTGGEAVARFALIMNNASSTVTLTNKGEQIGDQTDVNGLHQINEGTLDLNGFDESLGALSTSTGAEPGGIVTNSDGVTTSTLTLLGVQDGGVPADAFWPGSITGNLNLVKQGANGQVLTGTNTYTGTTTVNEGAVVIGQAAAIPASGVGVSVAAGAGFGFIPAGLSDAEMETIVSNVTWDAASGLVFVVEAPNTEVVSADLSSFTGDTILLRGDGTLDLTGATLPAGLVFLTPDGGTILGADSPVILIDSITVGAGSVSGKSVTIAFTATGNVDAYASNTMANGSWTLVASAIASSPALVEDNVSESVRFYVLVPEGSGDPYP